MKGAVIVLAARTPIGMGAAGLFELLYERARRSR
jgi:hypothetical protein